MPNQGSDPRLDAALNETFAELAEAGQGVSPSEVVAPARARPRRQSTEDDGTWFDQEQPGRQTRRQQGERAAQVILEEADTDEDDGDTPRRGPQRDSQGRFLPSRADTDEDDDDVASDSDEDDEEEQ